LASPVFPITKSPIPGEEKILDIGPIQATAEKEKSIPLPPLLGGLILIAGIGLVAVGYKK
jgi:hypothetical protein